MRVTLIATSIIASLLILTACGQKGPLYIPQEPIDVAPTTTEKNSKANTAETKLSASSQ